MKKKTNTINTKKIYNNKQKAQKQNKQNKQTQKTYVYFVK